MYIWDVLRFGVFMVRFLVSSHTSSPGVWKPREYKYIYIYILYTYKLHIEIK